MSIIVAIYLIDNFDTNLSPRSGNKISYDEYKIYKIYEKIIKKNLDGTFSDDVVNINELAISNTIKSLCNGYVLYNNNDAQYDIYIKCNNYQTVGFLNEFLK